jgi:hypothetical protein
MCDQKMRKGNMKQSILTLKGALTGPGIWGLKYYLFYVSACIS